MKFEKSDICKGLRMTGATLPAITKDVAPVRYGEPVTPTLSEIRERIASAQQRIAVLQSFVRRAGLKG